MSVIGKFKAEDFETAEDGFRNLLSQKMSTAKAELRYVFHSRFVPEGFPDFITEHMYQIWISVEYFGEDNRTISGCSTSM